ncbi:uncharacterized protein K441DRAFT_656988, partial [Cenococcum geophilum 1.58]|uniref:uncharacterized protein n=1 Tax=Cenococcum geophilum 1.58 TaxID=794803 RepID=UPI00358F4C0A
LCAKLYTRLCAKLCIRRLYTKLYTKPLCVCARHTTIGSRYIPDSLYTCLCQVYPLYTPR